MATISSPGIGSGLDVASIVSQLMAIESQPKTNLVKAATKIQTQISEVGKVTSALSKVRDLSLKLSSNSFWQQTVATSSNADISVTSSNSALAANYSVAVQQLAGSQALIGGQSFSSSTAAVGTGTLTIEMGSWGPNQTTFTAASTPSSASIAVDATDTVATLRDKINAAGIGVTASILSDASGARLVMRSASTGASNAFRTSVSGATGGVATLGFDPSSGVAGATQTKAAADAKATVDGVSVTSNTNTFANVLDGVSFTANAVTTSPANVTVSSDTATMKKVMQDFAAAYSDLNALIATDTKYDAANNKAGPLQGDSSVVDVQTSMRALLSASSSASSSYARLSDAGFELQRDGSLTVNSTKLDNALSNFAQLKALFVDNPSSVASAEGFGKQFYDKTYSMLTTGGLINARSTALSDRLQRNQKAQDQMDQRLAQTQARLTKEYGALDTRISSLNGLSNYVTQQVAQWNKA
jgi:flagellar hook-associated protein 2